jgi:glutaredoxin
MNSQRHLVLRSKKNGKVASRTDQNMIALRLKAIQLSASGRGGGIVSLLLPGSKRDKEVLEKASSRYEVVEVRKRSTQERQRIRSEIEGNNFLIVALANLYLKSINQSPYKILLRDFARWICTELANHNSDACELVFSVCPALADRQSPSWWEKQFAQRRKNLKQRREKTAS